MSDLKQKPFDIPKRLVWEAYRKVAANKGAAGVDGTALKNLELWLLVSGFWLMVTRWLQVDSGIVMASGSP